MLAKAVASQAKKANITALLATSQDPTALHEQRKIMPAGRIQNMITAAASTGGTGSEEQPPYVSTLSCVSNSLRISKKDQLIHAKMTDKFNFPLVNTFSRALTPDDRQLPIENRKNASKLVPAEVIMTQSSSTKEVAVNNGAKRLMSEPKTLRRRDIRMNRNTKHPIRPQTTEPNQLRFETSTSFRRIPKVAATKASNYSPLSRSTARSFAPLTLNIKKLSRVQTRTRVSSPSDSAELEARAISREVARMTIPPLDYSLDVTQTTIPSVSREAASINTIQSKAVTDGHSKAEPAGNNTLKMPGNIGAGLPLPDRILRFMEPRFNTDLSHVRIHTGEQSVQLSKQLNAQAFTVGSHIFFGNNEFQPYTLNGLELIAHEITHTFQQGSTIRRSELETHPQEEERGGLIGEALDYIAEKANLIPGFRMFTIILGVNPINMGRVERSPANILRALIEFIPGGALITQALDNHGVFDKVATWVGQQIETLGLVGSSIKQALNTFLDSLGWSDLLHPGDVWERAKRIFTEPIDRIINFAKGLENDIIKFIKDAILMPIAKLAEGTRGWNLLIAVLGKNPITGEKVSRNAETLIGGFMKLIGQEEVWENMKKANAIGRAWAWFKGAMSSLTGFVEQIPTLATNAFEALTLEDVVLLPRAFVKVGAVFANFLGDFISWAGNAVWHLLEIIFDVVSPGALSYIKRTGAALKSILKNPLPFVGNLVKAAKLGFQNFADHFGEHLKAGLIDWLTGALTGVYIPKGFSLGEIVKFVFSVLAVTWENVRQKLVKVVGEPAVKAMETGFDIVVTLVSQGPAAAWDKIQEQLSNLKDTVIGGITNFVIDIVVKKAIPKLTAMFIPGVGFISAILSIYDTIMVFVNKLSQIGQVVIGFINSIVAIASGDIEGAASRVEKILAGILSLAINFMAGFVGLGSAGEKVMGVINKVRVQVDKGLDALIAWIVKMAKQLFAKLFGIKEKEKRSGDVGESVPFSAGNVQHRIFIQVSGTHTTVMLASAPEPLEEALSVIEGKISTLSPPLQNKAAALLVSTRSLLSKTDREADMVAAAIAAPGASGTETATSADDQVKSDEHSLADMLGELLVMFDGAAGLPFSTSVDMGGVSHSLTIKDENDHMKVWFASREGAIRDRFGEVDRLLKRWEEYIDNIGNPAIKEEFTVLIKPEIKAKKTSSLEAAVARLEGLKSSDFMKLKTEIDATVKELAAEISTWASGEKIHVRDFSDEAINAELERRVEEESERIWKQRQSETQEKLQQFVSQIQALDPAARLKYRGSLAKKRKGVAKGFAHFDPWNFDVDLFVESDLLYSQVPGKKDPGEVDARRHPELSNIMDEMAEAYDSISGVQRGSLTMLLRTTSSSRELRAKSGQREFAGERHFEITPPRNYK